MHYLELSSSPSTSPSRPDGQHSGAAGAPSGGGVVPLPPVPPQPVISVAGTPHPSSEGTSAAAGTTIGRKRTRETMARGDRARGDRHAASPFPPVPEDPPGEAPPPASKKTIGCKTRRPSGKPPSPTSGGGGAERGAAGGGGGGKAAEVDDGGTAAGHAAVPPGGADVSDAEPPFVGIPDRRRRKRKKRSTEERPTTTQDAVRRLLPCGLAAAGIQTTLDLSRIKKRASSGSTVFSRDDGKRLLGKPAHIGKKADGDQAAAGKDKAGRDTAARWKNGDAADPVRDDDDASISRKGTRSGSTCFSKIEKAGEGAPAPIRRKAGGGRTAAETKKAERDTAARRKDSDAADPAPGGDDVAGPSGPAESAPLPPARDGSEGAAADHAAGDDATSGPAGEGAGGRGRRGGCPARHDPPPVLRGPGSCRTGRRGRRGGPCGGGRNVRSSGRGGSDLSAARRPPPPIRFGPVPQEPRVFPHWWRRA
mmetsp:Transcript_10257/g.20617  ORF Transcript_10257/g.20617 Transcript_10257/m.20617 type:complete len:479 (+) Transcript_10257:356-1792(+)